MRTALVSKRFQPLGLRHAARPVRASACLRVGGCAGGHSQRRRDLRLSGTARVTCRHWRPSRTVVVSTVPFGSTVRLDRAAGRGPPLGRGLPRRPATGTSALCGRPQTGWRHTSPPTTTPRWRQAAMDPTARPRHCTTRSVGRRIEGRRPLGCGRRHPRRPLGPQRIPHHANWCTASPRGVGAAGPVGGPTVEPSRCQATGYVLDVPARPNDGRDGYVSRNAHVYRRPDSSRTGQPHAGPAPPTPRQSRTLPEQLGGTPRAEPCRLSRRCGDPAVVPGQRSNESAERGATDGNRGSMAGGRILGGSNVAQQLHSALNDLQWEPPTCIFCIYAGQNGGEP